MVADPELPPPLDLPIGRELQDAGAGLPPDGSAPKFIRIWF